MPVVATAGRAVLRDYGGAGPPAIFVPSLINPPLILDLAPANSLLRWLAEQGVRPLLVDWGTPGAADAGLSVAGHVADLLLPLLAALGTPAHLVGYCLGGTMAIAAALAAPVLSLTAIAAPWHFAGFGAPARAEIGALWAAARPACTGLGLVPMEVLQAGFWQLDPGRTIAKFEAFGRMDPASDAARAFVALEDWANAGAPLTLAAGRELFEDFVAADLPGRGGWHVAGQPVDPARLAVPAHEFVSRHDRIVPAASAAGLAAQTWLDLGHVGMIVGARARAALWQPLAASLSQVTIS
jgi:polyhydroxyalkanoate synthase